MIGSIFHFGKGSRTTTATPAEAWAKDVPCVGTAVTREPQAGYTKVFRWPVPADQDHQPTIVEVVGSFTNWRRVPLAYDKVTTTWTVTLSDVPGNRTHRYVILVDGMPSYDKTCDGLAVPCGPEEEKWQLATAKGPRVMLMFGQTK